MYVEGNKRMDDRKKIVQVSKNARELYHSLKPKKSVKTKYKRKLEKHMSTKQQIIAH